MSIPKSILFTSFCVALTLGVIFFVKTMTSTSSETETETETAISETITQPFPTTTPTTVPSSPTMTQNAGSAGILDHDTYISFSDDPTSFPSGTLVAESASVPDLLICTADSSVCKVGEFLIYFVDPLNETDSMEGVSFVRSIDSGKTWSERELISITGKVNKGPAVDPSVVQLSDGTVRMYYYGPDKPFGSGPVVQGEKHFVYSATSVDGVTFTADAGTRLGIENLTDPEVIPFGSEWLMYYSVGTSSGVAVSDDGLLFSDKGVISLATGGVPGALVVDNGVYVYGCKQGITSAFSSDGITFNDLTKSILPPGMGGFCDPSLAEFENEFILVYKIAPPKTKTPVTP